MTKLKINEAIINSEATNRVVQKRQFECSVTLGSVNDIYSYNKNKN